MQGFTFSIDGKEVPARSGQSILEAALDAGVYIPHLCHHHDLPDIGGCGLCVVETGGKTVRACSTEVEPGMKVVSRSGELEHIRTIAMQLMLAGHIDDCNSCPKYLKCEFQMLIQHFGVTVGNMRRTTRGLVQDEGNPLFIRDMERCVACGRCVRVCRELRGVGAIVYADDDKGRKMISTRAPTLWESDCRFCGACVEVCPTGALRDKDGVFAERFCRGDMLVPCAYECPVHLDIPAYLRSIRSGDVDNAMAVIMERAPLPRSLGSVCMRFCESKCRRSQLDEPVAVCSLKHYAADASGSGWKAGLCPRMDTGKQVAVVGAGPAGLTAAWLLRLLGHGVTIFEKHPEPGGMMRYGMPSYRLAESELRADIDEILGIGVGLRCCTEITGMEQLEEFDAVLWCGGTHRASRLPLEGADGPGVWACLDFLRVLRMGEKPRIGKKVLVLGGGDVAFDCARSAMRLGVEAAVCCLEPPDAMPATERERAEGGEEGVGVFAGRAFVRILTSGVGVTGVVCRKVAAFAFMEGGKLKLETEPGSEHVIPCDTVIFAVGQKPDIPAGMGIALTEAGLAAVDGDCMTCRTGLFAAGDATGGTSSVVEAVGWAQRAAAGIDRYLGGDGDVIPSIARKAARPKKLGENPWFGGLRGPEKFAPAAERRTCFEPYEELYSADEALRQASRCLQCDLRRDIARSRFYSEFAFRREVAK